MIVMYCEYCHQIGFHYSGCPNYPLPKSDHYCSICHEPIITNEKYIINDCGEYAHWECVDYAEDLAKFLNCKIYEKGEKE